MSVSNNNSQYDLLLDTDTRNSLSVIINKVSPESTILEFGPAFGRLSKYLVENLKCQVYAVEADKNAEAELKKVCQQVIIGDIESYAWVNRLDQELFDTIIFADVLEHLINPEEAIKAALKLLKKNGNMIVSIPNVAHNAILMELFQDKFTYQPLGLLDYTHLRFFTQSSFKKMIRACDLHVHYEAGIYLAPEYTEFNYSYSSYPQHISNYLQQRENGEIYQYVFELKKAPTSHIIRDYPSKQLSSFKAQLSLYHSGKIPKQYSLNIVPSKERIELDFNFTLEKKLFKVDFSPLEQAVAIKIHSIEAITNNSTTHSLTFHPIDRVAQNNEIDYFLQDSKGYCIDIPDDLYVERIKIQLTYYMTGDKLMDKVSPLIQQQIHEYKQTIDSLETNLAHILGSTSWKITSVLRYLKTSLLTNILRKR